MGKCVDFFVCIVIMFDLNLMFDEFGVSWFIALNMMYLEIVMLYNIDCF